MKGILMLEDGSVFKGLSAGTAGEKIGEVMLQTSVVGYQEIMTDPANCGKIVIFTYPLIGNYGTADKFYESKACCTQAVVMKEQSRIYSNWQAEDSFDNFLKKENALALSGIDTRTLAVHIRDNGQQLGIVSTKQQSAQALMKKLKDYKKTKKDDFIKAVSVKKITEIKTHPKGLNIAILDIGLANNLIVQLKNSGCNVTLLPYNTEASKILDMNIKGLVVSSGPEQDGATAQVATTVKKLLGRIPILGLSAGCEIIALALGCKIKKLKIGHHGANYPVKAPSSYKGEITVQNHSCIIDENSLKGIKGIEVTLRNLNDNTIEEMQSNSLKFIAAQYYPQSPGFSEVNKVFERFIKLITKNKK